MEANECINTLTGHTEGVDCLENLSNSQFISGSDDKSLKIWDSVNGSLIKTLDGINEEMACVKLLLGNKVAVGCFYKIKILNIEDDSCINTIDGHTGWVWALTLLQDGTLASGSNDKTIKFWNINNGQSIKTLNGHTHEVYCLLLLSNGQLASGSADKTIKIWNTDTGECIKILKGHTLAINGLESSENFELISCSNDKTIKIWNVNTGECIKTLVGHNGGIKCIKS